MTREVPSSRTGGGLIWSSPKVTTFSTINQILRVNLKGVDLNSRVCSLGLDSLIPMVHDSDDVSLVGSDGKKRQCMLGSLVRVFEVLDFVGVVDEHYLVCHENVSVNSKG